MEWGRIWRTLFCGWDGDLDLTALAQELTRGAEAATDERDAAAWVCGRIQGAY
jgi:hypothetical protein